MQIQISTGAGVAIYRQIVNQVKYIVASGRLEAGDRLPSIRQLAKQLLINPNTVARAYRELEQEGVIETRQGAGTTVTDRALPLARKEKVRILSERIDALLTEARQLGIDHDEIVRILERRQKDLKTGRKKAQ